MSRGAKLVWYSSPDILATRVAFRHTHRLFLAALLCLHRGRISSLSARPVLLRYFSTLMVKDTNCGIPTDVYATIHSEIDWMHNYVDVLGG